MRLKLKQTRFKYQIFRLGEPFERVYRFRGKLIYVSSYGFSDISDGDYVVDDVAVYDPEIFKSAFEIIDEGECELKSQYREVVPCTSATLVLLKGELVPSNIGQYIVYEGDRPISVISSLEHFNAFESEKESV